ncbi:MAG: exonuclease domain-containing protein [Bacillota bacterium]|nr:exonuclease domain-containing protein [Bacillota bacterium]HHU42838.1 hypothetical protein [Clostridiales bacterium]
MNETLFMQKLLERLDEEQRIIKLSLAQLKQNKHLKLLFIAESSNYDKYLNQKLKKKIHDIALELIPDIFKLSISYKKTITEEKYILNETLDFVYNQFPTIFSFIRKAKINTTISSELIVLDIYAQKFIYDFCIKSELAEKLARHLETCFMEDVLINIIEVPNAEDFEDDSEDFPDFDNAPSIKLIDINITKHLVGAVAKKPRYISDIKDAEYESMTVCGAISGLKGIEYKSKEGCFYTFNINDTTGILPVKFFPHSKKAKLCGEELKDGDILAIEGSIKFDKFSRNFCLYANRIAECEINYDSINTLPKYKKEPRKYTRVFPKKYVLEEQTELFGFSNSENSDIFKDTLYVIFDLETTGIGTADKITEIGAVKMKDGKIVEIFETLVNPEMKLSDNIIELTGITNDMVEGAPKFEEVVADFYKFTRGAVLVAHNTRFDLDFLRKQALPLLYNFDNDSLDTMMIAQQYMKLKNYKLKTVCKEFGVEIENAHRALNDAIATARVFKKLMLLIKNKR